MVLERSGQFDLGIVRPYFALSFGQRRTHRHEAAQHGLDTITDFRLDVTVDGTPRFPSPLRTLAAARDFDCMFNNAPALARADVSASASRCGPWNGQPLDENPSTTQPALSWKLPQTS